MTYFQKKDSYKIQIQLKNKEIMDANCFLDPDIYHQSLIHRISLLIDQDTQFIPIQAHHQDQIILLSKQNIDLIMTPIPVDDHHVNYHRNKIPLNITTLNNQIISGYYWGIEPAGQQRLLDVLNNPCRFISIFTGETVYWINKSSISQCSENYY